MKVIDLLKRLNNLNISLEVIDNQLVIEVEKGVVSEEILTEIREKKLEIIELLNGFQIINDLMLRLRT